MPLINIVTAVSRPENLPCIHASMESAMAGHEADVRWIMVFDTPWNASEGVARMLAGPSRVRMHPALYPGGPTKFGIHQKNMGMDLIEDGFYHCLDDDNIVYPKFFEGVTRLIRNSPNKKAFVFSQRRWDLHGDLRAMASRMNPCFIDNTMFVVHKALIGTRRYDPDRAGLEDYYFFRALYDQEPGAFEFSDDFLAYYNYLRHFPQS